ncbi:MAG: hypothetical protein IKM61_06565 [Eubacteriaceae bacterium]|nr:hypothetical protein [Eubacteriaceae bacterium]
MATRPVYLPKESYPYYIQWDVDFEYNKGLSASQKQKNIMAIHDKFRNVFPESDVLEISRKSLSELGVSLSAFNLKMYVPSIGKEICVENIYQGGKVFENGMNYPDLYHLSPKDAKRDERLKSSGKIVGFRFEGKDFPANPVNAFYDYIYISALSKNEQLAKEVVKYDGFTDIEFNPKTGLNCQARAAAVFTSLYRLGLTDKLDDFNEFLRILNSFPQQIINETTGNTADTLTISEGDEIIHKVYGKGKVTAVSENAINVTFVSGIQKKLSKAWAEENCKLS